MAASGSGGNRADNGYGSQQPRRRKGPGALATAYLVIYNVVMTAGWLVIAVGLVRAYLAKGSYHSLYYSIEKPLKFFQTGALLEEYLLIAKYLPGIVPSSVVLTAFQVMSRVFLTWAVTHSVKEVQTEDSVLLFVMAWTITEIIRYSFYTFSLLNHLPYLIKWAR
ncbi:HACD2 dehydratase, partial [Calonectris borealis]|nr:HACD2 dehydratase [Calonectris borealis]